MLKWLKLGGIAVAAIAVILGANWLFFEGPSAQPNEITLTDPPAEKPPATPTPSPSPTPKPTNTINPPSLGALLAGAATPKPMPPRPAALQNQNQQNQAGGGNSSNPNISNAGGSGGGGGGNTGGAGTGAGAGAGTGTGTSTNSPTATSSTGDYWLQTADDPAGSTPNGSRHNKTCVKYKNVQGQNCDKSQGTPCPRCGG